jgi:hypothetical protein
MFALKLPLVLELPLALEPRLVLELPTRLPPLAPRPLSR